MTSTFSVVVLIILFAITVIALLLFAIRQVKEANAEEEKEEKLIKEWSASSVVKKDQGNDKKIIETKLKIPKGMGHDLTVRDRFIASREYREDLTDITAGHEDNDGNILLLKQK